MDLLVKLAEKKARSIAYKFNNLKIRKIISIQRKKETIIKTVDKIKEKVKRWRQFTKTTLDPNEGKSTKFDDLKTPLLNQNNDESPFPKEFDNEQNETVDNIEEQRNINEEKNLTILDLENQDFKELKATK